LIRIGLIKTMPQYDNDNADDDDDDDGSNCKELTCKNQVHNLYRDYSRYRPSDRSNLAADQDDFMAASETTGPFIVV